MRSPILQIGLLLTAISLFINLAKPAFTEALTRAGYDFLIQHDDLSPESGQVAIVDIDEASLEQFGQWQWPRYKVAKLIDSIFASGARVIALDIMFPEQDRTSLDQVTSDLNDFFGQSIDLEGLPENYPSWDAVLAKSLASGNTVLGCYMHGEDQNPDETHLDADQQDPYYRGYFYVRGSGNAAPHLPHAEHITISIPELNQAAGNNGFFNTMPDRDTIVRENPLVWSLGEDRMYPSLALEAVRMYLDVPQVGIELDESDGIEGLRLKNRFIPTDIHGKISINYRKIVSSDTGKSSSFPTFSAALLLNDTLPEGSLKDKIVFIGTSAAGLHDLRSTPIKRLFPGVEINATIADNILVGDALFRPYWVNGVEFLAIILIGFLLTLSVSHQQSWLSFFVATGMIAISGLFSLYLLRSHHLIFVPTYTISTIVIMYPVLSMISYWKSEREMRWIRNNFGAMVSDKVLQYIEEHPDSVTQKGHMAEATILFSDIEGFTSIAERLSPEEVADFVETYMSPMTDIIMDHDGYVDKYIGDMIMADWGVPFPMEDQAIQACDAALEQLAKVEELQEEFVERFKCSLNIRIGINCGDVIAGNMGSEKRHQFTVLGDPVNVASRLEPLNKVYGTKCLISEHVAEKCGGLFATRKLDLIAVDGKTKPIWVYELLGRNSSVPTSVRHSAALYEKAFDAYYTHRDIKSALSFIKLALEITPDDTALKRLCAIIENADKANLYQETPPRPSEPSES